MILIKNTQRTIKLNTKQLEKDIQKLLIHLGYADFDIGIWFTSNATIKKYNKQFRNKDKITDVLSFPFYPDLKPGKQVNAKTTDEKNLGDIIIAPVYVQKAAMELGVSLNERLMVVIVHGICHLLGYDHIAETDYKIMQKKEDELHNVLRSKNPRFFAKNHAPD